MHDSFLVTLLRLGLVHYMCASTTCGGYEFEMRKYFENMGQIMLTTAMASNNHLDGT